MRSSRPTARSSHSSLPTSRAHRARTGPRWRRRPSGPFPRAAAKRGVSRMGGATPRRAGRQTAAGSRSCRTARRTASGRSCCCRATAARRARSRTLESDIPVGRSFSPLGWFPDGSRLVFPLVDPLSRADRERIDGGDDRVVYEEEPRFWRLWTADPWTGAVAPISPPGLQVWEFAISPDGKRVAAIASDEPYEWDWYDARLVVFDVGATSKTDVHTIHQTKRQVAKPIWSPDGFEVAFLSSTWSDRGYDAGQPMVVSRGRRRGPGGRREGDGVGPRPGVRAGWAAPGRGQRRGRCRVVGPGPRDRRSDVALEGRPVGHDVLLRSCRRRHGPVCGRDRGPHPPRGGVRRRARRRGRRRGAG